MSSFASYDGTTLHYDQLGSGPPLLCVPGGPGRAVAYLEDLGGLDAEHIQLGTGSWDQTVGLSYTYGPRPWTLFANVQGRLNTANSRGFRYGHALFATAGARRSFLESGRLIGSLEAQLRTAGFDRLSDGSVDPDSGGSVLYSTASVAYALTPDLMMRGIFQVPTATWLHGTQSEHPVAYVALSYDFEM